jgi:hypothetical protein
MKSGHVQIEFAEKPICEQNLLRPHDLGQNPSQTKNTQERPAKSDFKVQESVALVQHTLAHITNKICEAWTKIYQCDPN